MCIYVYAIFSIDSFHNLFFDVKKEYKEIIMPDSPKTYCSQAQSLCLTIDSHT